MSLFGYDFKADHAALTLAGSARVDLIEPQESLVLAKPVGDEEHGGGELFAEGGWEYNVLRAWVEAGARQPGPGALALPAGGEAGGTKDAAAVANADGETFELAKLVRLEVTPAEIVFPAKLSDQGSVAEQAVALQAVAVWEDGSREDVTPLCRFRTNDAQIATIDSEGVVTGGGPGDTHVVVFYDKGVVPVPVLRPVSELSGENYPDVATPTRVDELVVQKLRKLGIQPSEVCDDATFLRRLSLDLTGTLPTADEVEAFLANPSGDKRQAKIEEYLASDSYAAWWATRLSDYTGNAPSQLNNVAVNGVLASRQWYEWIYVRLKENVPYDEIVAGIVLGESREEGETYLEYCQSMSEICRDPSGRAFAEQRSSMPYYWMRREFRDGNSRAISFAHSFLGIRIQCAQCHKHPFDRWTQTDFREFAQLFTSFNPQDPRRGSQQDQLDLTQVLEQVGLDPELPQNRFRREVPRLLRQGKTVPFNQYVSTGPRPLDREDAVRRRREKIRGYQGRVLGGELAELTRKEDPRQRVLRWLRSADNPYFAKALVNRVWANYFNVGIVSPTDDLNLANPPSNAPLMEYLSQGFIDSGYDLRWLHREIVSSRTYQTSWQPNDTNRNDLRNFSHAMPRRLPAEVVHDMLVLATGNDELQAATRQELTGRAIAGQVGLDRRNRDRRGD